MDKGEKKDFKSVKVSIKGAKNESTLSRSMLYSGVNIFGQLSNMYLNNREQFMSTIGTQTSSAKGSASIGVQEEDSQNDLLNLPQELVLIFKRIQKKDPITRCKAFAELDKFVGEMDSKVPYHQNLVTFFLYHFCRIMVNESDKKVRESAQITLGSFIKKGASHLADHMRKVFPIWFCSFFDSAPEVALLARQNYQDAFQKKQGKVFQVAYKYFLHFADETLKQTEEQFSEGENGQKIVREETYDRIISSIFNALAESFTLTENWSDEDKEYYVKKMVSYLDIKAQDKTNNEKVKSKSFWVFLTKKYRGRVRSACLVFVSQFLKNVSKEEAGPHIQEVSPLIFDMISEDNSIIQGNLWREALFNLGKSYPEAWETISLKKAFIPSMLACVKNAGYGASTSIFPNLVKFVSVFPLFNLVDFQDDKLNKFNLKDRAKFLTQFCQHLFAGLKNDEASTYHPQLVGSYFEVLSFFILKRYQPFMESQSEDKEFLESQLKMVLELPINDFLNKYEKSKSEAFALRNVRENIPVNFCRMLKNLSEREANPEVMNFITRTVFDLCNERLEEANTLKFVKRVIKYRETFGNDSKYSEMVNEPFNVRLVQFLFEDQLIKTEFARKNLSQTLSRTQHLQKLVLCMKSNQLDARIFEVIKLPTLLELIKGFDRIQQSAAKVLQPEDIEKLNQLNQFLIIISLANLDKDSQTSTEDQKNFFKYVLLESEKMPFDSKLMVLLPSLMIKAKKPIEAVNFQQKLRQNNEIALQFASSHLIQNSGEIHQNSGYLQYLLESAFDDKRSLFSSKEQTESFACQILDQIEKSTSIKETCFYLRAAQPVLLKKIDAKQESSFSSSLVEKFHRSLAFSIFNTQNVIDKTQKMHYRSLWDLFQSMLKNQDNSEQKSLVDICTSHLKQTMAQVVKVINKEQTDEKETKVSRLVSYSDIEKIDALTRMIKDFVSLVEPVQRQEIIQTILMNQENFMYCEQNCLPMKIFRDMFLQGGVNFDVQSLFSKEKGLEYSWLASLLLNINNMNSLNNFPQLKKQLIIFLETEIVPAIILQTKDGNRALIISIVKTFKEKITEANDSCLSTLNDLLGKLVDPGEQYGFDEPLLKVDDFKQIFEILSKSATVELLARNYSAVSKTDIKLLALVLQHTTYFIIDEPEISQLGKFVKKNLHIDILSKAESMREASYSLYLYRHLYSHFTTEYDLELQECTVQWILNNFTEIISFSDSMQPKDKIFHLNVILDFIAHMMDKQGMNHFSKIIINLPEDTLLQDKLAKRKTERQQKEEERKSQQIESNEESKHRVEDEQEEASLESLVLQVINISHEMQIEPQTFINLLTLIRKVIPNSKIISEKQFLIDEIIEIAKDKVVNFNKKLQNFLKAQEQQNQQMELFEIVNLEEEMLSTFADTLITCTMYINQEVSEDSLYVLLGSGFDQLQKAAYFMLKHLYQNFVPNILFKKDEEHEIKMLQLMAQGQEYDEKRPEGEKGTEDEEEKKDIQARDKVEFKNVSQSLLDLIENPPNVDTNLDSDDEDTQISSEIEALIYGETGEGCLSKKAFGYLLGWSSLLQKIDNGGIKAQLSNRDDYIAILNTISEYFEQNKYIYQMLLVIIVAYLPKVKKCTVNHQEIVDFEPSMIDIDEKRSSLLMALFTLVSFMKSFPSLARKYYQEADKKLLEIVMPYIKQIVSPAILDNEIQKIETSQVTLNEKGQGEGLNFSLFKSTKEIMAEYTKGEVSMQLKITIPNDYPLKSVSVEVGQQIKISDRQKNKWVLAIKNLLQLRNGDIISAVLLWKSNIDKEIDGMEDCFICYCILHPTDKSLPRLPCKNCKNKFHVACIQKWFKTSNKSNCPLCQAYFF